MVVSSAVGRVVLCPLMATHIHSLLLFPLAFLVLVCSKLYLVTKGALVPEMAALDGPDESGEQAGYATLNARLTLLGTLAGFVVSVPAVILYKLGQLAGGARLGHDRVRRRRGGRRPTAGALRAGKAERLWTDEHDTGARVRPGRGGARIASRT